MKIVSAVLWFSDGIHIQTITTFSNVCANIRSWKSYRKGLNNIWLKLYVWLQLSDKGGFLRQQRQQVIFVEFRSNQIIISLQLFSWINWMSFVCIGIYNTSHIRTFKCHFMYDQNCYTKCELENDKWGLSLLVTRWNITISILHIWRFNHHSLSMHLLKTNTSGIRIYSYDIVPVMGRSVTNVMHPSFIKTNIGKLFQLWPWAVQKSHVLHLSSQR